MDLLNLERVWKEAIANYSSPTIYLNLLVFGLLGGSSFTICLLSSVSYMLPTVVAIGRFYDEFQSTFIS
jgi:hypothetical protein